MIGCRRQKTRAASAESRSVAGADMVPSNEIDEM